MKHPVKTFILAAIALCASIAANATDLKGTTPDGRSVIVTALTDNILRITNNAPGTSPLPTMAAVITEPQVDAVITEALGGQAITTATGLTAVLSDGDGELIISAPGVKRSLIFDNGVRTCADGKNVLTLRTFSNGSYYGAGERGHKLNLRGDTLTMYNRQNYGYTKGDPRINQMNITMPLIINSDGFAIVFDDYAASTLYLGNDGTIEYTTENPRPVSYYFVNGAFSIADVTEQLTALTGRQPLPPLWALGYITSKYGYHDQHETLGVVDTLKRNDYPVDGIVLDLYWYGKEQDMGRLEWDPIQWPDAKGMLRNLKKKGVNLVAISQPYVLRNGKAIDNYNYLAPEGMFVADSTGLNPQEVEIWVGEGGMFDVSNPETRQWLRNRYKSLTDMGITGWWGDLGEPEVHPLTGVHANGLNTRLYHNQYGNDWSAIISDLFAEEYPDTRLLTMMRGGTTGLQRYSVFPWSTDVSRSWGGLQPQVTIMLNSGLSGLGYMGHDVGGFAVDPENPEDAELYVRWLQLGLFSPMLRTHAQHKAEPYHYPQYASIIKSLIRERYRWLPYNYTLAYENATKGYPLVRPLNFYEAGSKAYDDIDDEYLWGCEVLVAPVMTQGATSRMVTFPQGTWVDYANPRTRYAGGSTVSYDAPLDVLPLFVRAGAIIPFAENKMNNTGDYNPGRLTIEYFPVDGVTSDFTLYDDNRQSPDALSSGNYRLIDFSATTAPNGDISIAVGAKGSYAGAPEKIEMQWRVRGLEKAPSDVFVNGHKASFRYNATTGQATFSVTFRPANSPLAIVIK